MTRSRTLSHAERDLWREAMRDVRRLHSQPDGQRPRPPAEPPTGSGSSAAAPPDKTVHARMIGSVSSVVAKPLALDPLRPVDIDLRSWQRLRRGRRPIDGRLDLHGMTQTAAHRALERFLVECRRRGDRCVLVITGKGNGRGVLRSMVPRWLEEHGNRANVIAYAPAQPEHGGEGALYVLLRRRR